MTETDIALMKCKWQYKQIKRLSHTASLYGPRESTKHLWINPQIQNKLIIPKQTFFQRIKKYLANK